MTRRLKLGVGVVLAALLLAWVLRGVDWSELARTLRSARPGPLIAVVLVTVAAYWVRAWRWGSLLAPLAQVRIGDLFSATMVGFASSLVVPRSGELLRPWLIARRHPIGTAAGFATIVIERLIDLICVLALFALYLWVLPHPKILDDNPLTARHTAFGEVAALAAIALLAFLLALHVNAERVLGLAERLLARAPRWLAVPLGKALHGFSGGLAVLRAPLPHLGLIGLQSAALWLLTAVSLHLVQIAFGIDLAFQSSFLLIAFLVVGEAIPTPGLVGGFHAFYVLALTQVYGIAPTTAAAASITAHALTNLPVLLLGAAYLGRERLNLRTVVR